MEPAAVRSFTETHGDRIAACAKREVRNKLETGYENPRTPVRRSVSVR